MNTMQKLLSPLFGLFGFVPRLEVRRAPALMVDIETLSRAKNAAVYAIGLHTFRIGEGQYQWDGHPLDEQYNVNKCFEILIKPSEYEGREGFDIEQGTVDWTLANAAALYARAERDGLTLEEAGRALSDFIIENKGEFICANSPTFDLDILSNLLSVLGLPRPWGFREEFDVRTMYHLRTLVGLKRYPKIEDGLVLHDAVDDCILQIRGIEGLVERMERRA